MEALKSLIRGLMSVWFKFGLVALAVVTSMMIVFGNPVAIKQAISSSGAYDKVIGGVLDQTDLNFVIDSSQTTLAIPRQELFAAAKSTLTPAVLKDATEQVVDGIYAWLQGKTPEPNFRIDLTAERQKFIKALADSAAARARQLPACNLQMLQELVNRIPNPWDLPCVPPGYDISTLRDKAVAEITRNGEFLKDPVITAEDFPKDGTGKSVFQTASDAPKFFGWFLIAPWIIAFLTLLSAGGLLLLHDNKRRAFRSIAVAMLGSGISLLVITAIYSLAFKQGFQLGGSDDSNVFQQPMLEAIRHLQNAVSDKLVWFGATYTIVGLLSLLALHFSKRVEEIQTATGAGENQRADDFNGSVLPPPAQGEDQNKADKGSL